MKLILFAFLSISNGNYESHGQHDLGTVDSQNDVGITVERRSVRKVTETHNNVIAFLKPWVLELINSKARDDRTNPKISTVSDRTIIGPVVRTGFWFWSGRFMDPNFIVGTNGPIIPVESYSKAKENCVLSELALLYTESKYPLSCQNAPRSGTF